MRGADEMNRSRISRLQIAPEILFRPPALILAMDRGIDPAANKEPKNEATIFPIP